MCKDFNEELSDDEEETPKKCCSFQPRVLRCLRRCMRAECCKCKKPERKFLIEREMAIEEAKANLNEDGVDAEPIEAIIAKVE